MQVERHEIPPNPPLKKGGHRGDFQGEETKPRASDKVGPLFGFITLFLLLAILASVRLHATRAFWILLVMGIGTLTAFVVLRFQEILNFFVSRQARYGANVATAVLLVLGIAFVVNGIVAQKLDKTADMTADRLYTLSEQTKKILHGLNREVKVLAFFRNTTDDSRAEQQHKLAKDMLERYRRETDKLHIEYVDPDADALKSEAYQIKFDGTTVFESGGKREHVTTVDEQKFTSAIMKVVRDEVKKVYFLTGHQEYSVDDFDRTGYSQAKSELEKQNYAVETLTLTTQPEVPSDCTALIIPGPKAPLTAHEVNAIAKYLDGNGKVLLMFEPSLNSANDPNQPLVDLMDGWGVKVGADLVFDRHLFFVVGGPAVPVVSNFEFHQITQYVRQPVLFQLARSVTPKTDAGKNLVVKSLAKTTDQIGGSWGETKRKADGTFDGGDLYTEGQDTPPPVSLAVAIQRDGSESPTEEKQDEPKESKTRIVVMGDSDFASNDYFKSTGGSDLFLNAVNWLTLEEDLIAIRPIDPTERSLRQMTANEAAFVPMASIFLIPLIVFMVGVGVWWRRR